MRLLLLFCFVIFSQISLFSWEKAFKQFIREPAPTWMEERIRADLAPFSQEGIKRKQIQKFMKSEQSKGNLNALILYQIKNNKITPITSGKASAALKDSRGKSMLLALERLSKVIKLPDTYFIASMDDLVDWMKPPVPIFSFAKNIHRSTNIVLIPDDGALAGYSNILTKVREGAKNFPWDQKMNQAFWRGAMTGEPPFNPNRRDNVKPEEDFFWTLETFLTYPRTNLVSLSLESPNVLDARYLPQGNNDPKEIVAHYPQYFASFLPIEEHLRYKYQILIDGNSCAYQRAYWQLFSNCVIFKQTSDAIQWYYDGLQPFVHYIPVHHDMSNLVEMILWAEENDALCEQMSDNAQTFARERITYSRTMQYLYLLLNRYAKLVI